MSHCYIYTASEGIWTLPRLLFEPAEGDENSLKWLYFIVPTQAKRTDLSQSKMYTLSHHKDLFLLVMFHIKEFLYWSYKMQDLKHLILTEVVKSLGENMPETKYIYIFKILTLNIYSDELFNQTIFNVKVNHLDPSSRDLNSSTFQVDLDTEAPIGSWQKQPIANQRSSPRCCPTNECTRTRGTFYSYCP